MSSLRRRLATTAWALTLAALGACQEEGSRDAEEADPDPAMEIIRLGSLADLPAVEMAVVDTGAPLPIKLVSAWAVDTQRGRYAVSGSDTLGNGWTFVGELRGDWGESREFGESRTVELGDRHPPAAMGFAGDGSLVSLLQDGVSVVVYDPETGGISRATLPPRYRPTLPGDHLQLLGSTEADWLWVVGPALLPTFGPPRTTWTTRTLERVTRDFGESTVLDSLDGPQVLWSADHYLPLVFSSAEHVAKGERSIAVGRSDEATVTVRSLDMSPVFEVTWHDQASAVDRTQARALLDLMVRQEELLGRPAPDYVRMPERFPSFSALVAGPNGDFWVRTGPWEQGLPPGPDTTQATWLRITPSRKTQTVHLAASSVMIGAASRHRLLVIAPAPHGVRPEIWEVH